MNNDHDDKRKQISGFEWVESIHFYFVVYDCF